MLRKVIQSVGNTYVRAGQLRMARMPNKGQEPLKADAEYKDYKSLDQMKNGSKEESKPWLNENHMSAIDEINHRGIDQRAKEWGVPVEKVEELKQHEVHAPIGNTQDYKQTIFKGQDQKKGSFFQPAQEQSRTTKFSEASKYNEVASGTQEHDAASLGTSEKASERKFTSKDTTAAQVQKEKPWLNDKHMSAIDEINHRGIDQRAKEWGIPVEQVEQLKKVEPTLPNTSEYKKTIFKGGDNLNKASGSKIENQRDGFSQNHETAIDEINNRGIHQRAKEWGVPADKLEKLKPWERTASESNTEAYKQTVMKAAAGAKGGKKEELLKHGFKAGNAPASNQTSAPFYDGGKFTHLTDAKQPDTNMAAADRKFTNKDSTAAQINYSVKTREEIFKPKAGFSTSKKSGSQFNDLASGTSKVAADIKYENKSENVSATASKADNFDKVEAKNAQNSEEGFDQGMVDKAMSWVKDKFGSTGSSGKEGPVGDHNATNKGMENHTDSVHKATFTEYQDAKEPFTTSVEDGQKKTSKKPVKDYLNQNQQ